jgi:hypothetical protein
MNGRPNGEPRTATLLVEHVTERLRCGETEVVGIKDFSRYSRILISSWITR